MRRCCSRSNCSGFEQPMGGSWQDVLDFWFLPPGDPQHGQSRSEWFSKDPGFDASIRARFEPLIDEAVNGGVRDWDRDPRSALARSLLLDQVTRNMVRDTPRRF